MSRRRWRCSRRVPIRGESPSSATARARISWRWWEPTPAYLRGAGLSFADVDGIVALDGAAYDVPAQFADGPGIMGRTYRRAFGVEPERQARLSPTVQAGAPNAAQFLILHVQREDGIRQSEALAAGLRKAGTAAETRGFAGTELSEYEMQTGR